MKFSEHDSSRRLPGCCCCIYILVAVVIALLVGLYAFAPSTFQSILGECGDQVCGFVTRIHQLRIASPVIFTETINFILFSLHVFFTCSLFWFFVSFFVPFCKSRVWQVKRNCLRRMSTSHYARIGKHKLQEKAISLILKQEIEKLR